MAEKVKLKKRKGFETRGMRALFYALFPFFYCRNDIPEEVANDGQPTVFVANHYTVFGPISFVLSFPFIGYTWMNEELVTPGQAAEAIYNGAAEMFPHLKENFLRKICTFLGTRVCSVMRRVGCIPVNRRSASKLMGTVRETVRVLEAGENVLIFPEKGQPHFSMTSVTDFYEGFTAIGAYYQRKTGKPLRFCPVYVDEQHHRFRCGESEYYDASERSATEENKRLSGVLHDRIVEIAAASRGVALEKSVPQRPVLLHLCNLVRILLIVSIAFFTKKDFLSAALPLYLLSQVFRFAFNAALDSLPATNHLSCLVSHSVSTITDILVLSRFAAQKWPGFLLRALIVAHVGFLFFNLRSAVKTARCAGTTYFDALSDNLFCLFNVMLIASIRPSGLAFHVISIFCATFLTCSVVCSFVFNQRIISE